MVAPLQVTGRLVVPSSDLSWSAARSAGPGGQNVNKTATKVDLRFDVTGTSALPEDAKQRLLAQEGNRLDADGRLVVTSQVTRDQSRNLEDARRKLAEMIRRALVRPKKRKPTKPSRGAVRRRLADKRRQGEKKRTRGPVSRDE